MKMKDLLRKILVMGIVALFLIAIGSAFFRVNMLAYAAGAIYIRADGSVEGTTFIVSSDNVTYVFTADINDCDIMYVQRSNIIVDGNGHVLNSSGIDAEVGIDVESVNNVTIQNVSIRNFPTGIYLHDAADNTITGNTVTNNNVGISINSCGNNTVSGNTVTGNNQRGIYLCSSANSNIISGNKVEGSPNGIGVEWSMNNVISGNNITANNITSYTYDGIYLYSSSGNSISGNYIADNSRYGISLTYYCSNNTLNGNNITANNDVGIRLDGYSSNNVISGNTVGNSPNEHICLLYSSNNNTISGNTLTNSTADVGVYVYQCSLNSFLGNNITDNANSGIRLDSSADSTISENNISENLNGVYLWYSSNITVSGNDITANNASGIILDSSGNNIISENNITANNEWGINPAYSNNNTISGNNIRNNNCGINSASSNFNIVSANNIIDNGYGMYLESSSNNTFYHNNLINNTNQAVVDELGYTNNWDDGYPSGGNYWSECTDVDNNSGPYQNITGTPDGIWDNPYIINENNTDRYPFANLYDDTPPTIGIPSRTPSGDILPNQEVTVMVNVTDNLSGVMNVTLCYTIDDGLHWNGTEMLKNPSTELYEANIPCQEYGKIVRFKIEAFDYAGNNKTRDGVETYCIYQIVPEFLSPTILVAFTMTILLLAIVFRKKRTLVTRNKI